MRTVTERPLRTLVTRTTDPNGSVRCAATSRRSSNASPFAAVRPWNERATNVANPSCSDTMAGGAGTADGGIGGRGVGSGGDTGAGGGTESGSVTGGAGAGTGTGAGRRPAHALLPSVTANAATTGHATDRTL